MKSYSKKEIGELIMNATLSVAEKKEDPEFFMLVTLIGAAIGTEVDMLIDKEENTSEYASKDEKVVK